MSTTKYAALFLDVDGVLNRCGDSNQGLESDKVELLHEMIASFPDNIRVVIVITSSWRENGPQLRRLVGTLLTIPRIQLTATPILPAQEGRRAAEIRAWMAANFQGFKCGAIIDDDPSDMGALEKIRVKPISEVGLTPEIIEQVKRMITQPVTNNSKHE